MRHFYFTGKKLLSDVAGIVRPECCMRVARGRFCNKVAGTVLQIIHRIEFLQHAADIGDTPWLSETIYYFDGKKVTQLPMPFVFINCSPIPLVLEMHINLSCCLWCLMKLTGICDKINFKFDSYSFIFVLSCLLSQKGKWIDFINF